jgi:hypothetical protein
MIRVKNNSDHLPFLYAVDTMGVTHCVTSAYTRMLALVIGILIGFAGGYFVRENISRRRHAAARERMREKELQLFNQKCPESMRRPKKQFSITGDRIHWH